MFSLVLNTCCSVSMNGDYLKNKNENCSHDLEVASCSDTRLLIIQHVIDVEMTSCQTNAIWEDAEREKSPNPCYF